MIGRTARDAVILLARAGWGASEIHAQFSTAGITHSMAERWCREAVGLGTSMMAVDRVAYAPNPPAEEFLCSWCFTPYPTDERRAGHEAVCARRYRR